MKGLEKITGRIVSDAEAYRDALKAQAEKDAASVRADYEKKAAALLARSAEEGEAEAQALLSRAEAAAGSLRSGALLRARGDALDAAFDRAQERLMAMGKEEKLSFLVSLASSMLEEAIADDLAAKEREGEDYLPVPAFSLALSPADTEEVGKELLSRLVPRAKAAGKTLTLASPAPIEGGAVLKAGDIENNCSLSRLIGQVRREKEGELLSVLFPEEGTR